MAMGGALKAGDQIDVLIKGTGAAPLTVFEDILVLDVRANVDNHANNDKMPSHPFVIVTALPADKRDGFGAMPYNRKLVVAHKITPGI
jgi:hypothetical protein